MTTGGARRLVGAPDKFRGTASASAVAAAIGRAALAVGWESTAMAMADGGEGLLDAMGGREQRAEVTGPLGAPVLARWACLEDPEGFTAVIEMAEAAGLALVGGGAANDPLRATTAGVGELILLAVGEGAHTVLVGCGGSATTDGGSGAVEVIGDPAKLAGTQIIVACDVRAPFLDAARVFAPQKGASPAQVTALSRRLESLAGDYRDRFGVDVTSLIGAGAAGGLAGGLAALGAKLTSGFELVARRKGLRAALEGADLVVTGEGRLDATSFDGKVVGGVVALAGPTPVLCITGEVAPGAELSWPPGSDVTLVSLTERYGGTRARAETAALVEEVVARELAGR